MKEYILDSLKKNPDVVNLTKGKAIANISLMQQALVLARSYLNKPRPMVYVCHNLYEAQQLYDRLVSILDDSMCALFGVEDSLRVEAIASSPEMMANKVETLANIINDNKRIIVLNSVALVKYLPNVKVFKEACKTIQKDDIIEMEDLKRYLIGAGYQQVSHIDTPLTFAKRGGIIDVYSINYDKPIRIEFFDNIIDSIRFFDCLSQKTIEEVDSVNVIPAGDILFSDVEINEIEEKALKLLKENEDEELRFNVESDLNLIKNYVYEPRFYTYYAFVDDCNSIIEYFDDCEIIYSDKELCERSINDCIQDNTSYIQEMVQEHKLLPRYSMFFDLYRVENKHRIISLLPFGDNTSDILEVNIPSQRLELKLKMLVEYNKPVLLFLKDNEFSEVVEGCVNMQIPYNIDSSNVKNGLNLCLDELYEGFETSEYIAVTSKELFEEKPRLSRFAQKFKSAQIINTYQDLQPLDYVVHQQHGVGQYLGIETRKIMGIHKDFLRIVYKGNAELLVPLEQFKLVRKFVSGNGVVPKLNKLGSDEWTKTKQRLEESVEDIAGRLLELYSKRKQDVGFAFPKDDETQREFEKGFQYELTNDQAKAIQEVKADMESPYPMDRLLCGDVGFGKTEVAIRAACKAVCGGKQVAYLCPTTILASQHYRTFCKRFSNFPVNVRLLNRFVTPAAQKEIINDIKEGKVDIVIGTHRILSNDIKFKQLGLLIIDEEQRFGVEQKEKIKELRVGIDVLSLSATPIPRSLQMSLVGIRQLSQLESPPNNRHMVSTYVVEKNKGLIKNAIEKELSRKGQVFYLFNNVDLIYAQARQIQELVPEARVQVAHGKMSKEEIEDVMASFINYEIDVLVCTTIVETGIDIPNANTMIIDNAQNFGLAQLYQIKGRVGRSEAIAYAYLMIPPKKQLSEVADKRLKAIKEFAKLGSGYKIAMRDLTIRGAGDLLGAKQSGFIDTVGIDMYIEMLEAAIKRQKGIVVEKVVEDTKPVNVNVDSYIPQEYVEEDYDKISMYQDIDKIKTYDMLVKYRNKILDEYGRLPESFDNLFDKKHLELLINSEQVDRFRELKGVSEITFSKSFSDSVDGVKLFEICTNISRSIKMKYTDQKIILTLPKTKDIVKQAIRVIEDCREAIR